MADVLGHVAVPDTAARLAELSDAVVGAALAAARTGVDTPPVVAVIALGSWGGAEMSYSSDADLVMVVADDEDPYSVRKAAQILGAMRALLKVPGPGPDLHIDVDLRPEGKDGPLVRTLASYRAYYEKWGSVWEAQALLRARFAAGDPALAAAFLAAVDPVRYPAAGLSPAGLTEIRRLKARMEAERIGRGIDPRDHLKLGPGGLTDVEWTVQSLQLRYAGGLPALRVPGTLAALDAAVQAGLVRADDAEPLCEAFLLAARIRDAITLVRNKAADVLPADASDLGQVASVLGYDGGSYLADEWHRVARRARAITDRLFWADQRS
jgi:glutamate-ammonia-ligase adenylyltransferase